MKLSSDDFTKVKAYFDLLRTYQAKLNDGLVMTYDKGYWWCASDPTLTRHEEHFLHIGLDTESLIQALTQVTNPEEKVYILHLLGWAAGKKKAGDVLVRYVTSSQSAEANAALRALFPFVVTGKYVLDSTLIRTLLYARPLVIKNKILGLLAFLPKKKLVQILNDADRIHIKQLTQHRNKPLIATPAQMVVQVLG